MNDPLNSSQEAADSAAANPGELPSPASLPALPAEVVGGEAGSPAPVEPEPLDDDMVPATEGPLLDEEHLHPRRRRVLRPLVLFLITCLSTFFAGATHWTPTEYMYPGVSTVDTMEGGDWRPNTLRMRRAILANWKEGLIYMTCVLAILLTHEMGHFLATVRYRIPASLPYFIPFPITPLGTMGAVIGMDGLRANRREMFDIGLAGPLAGLVVALPITYIGIQQLDLSQNAIGPWNFDCPLLVRMMFEWMQPTGYNGQQWIRVGQMNPFFMAGWVGLLITGLNMMPVSQLDGGHVIYTLFGRRAHWIARGFILFAIFYVVWFHATIWYLMLILVILIGTDHPPTADDNVPLGPVRTILGYASLAIPFFCFPSHGLVPVGM